MSEQKETYKDKYTKHKIHKTNTEEEKLVEGQDVIKPEKDGYEISKPRRILIKAVIAHD